MERLAFVFGVIATLFPLFVITRRKDTQPKNNVHFYVARNANGGLTLWIGKPTRDEDVGLWFCHEKCALICTSHLFSHLNLTPYDFKKLKWEDEPQEVFIKL